MIKNVLIVVLIILLSISTYLLIEKEGSVLKFWSRILPGQKSETQVRTGVATGEVEKLEPISSPELYTDASVGLIVEEDEDEATEGAIHLKYKLIRPTVIEILDSNGSLAVKIDLDSGEAVFGSSYTPDEASIQFWKSIAEEYPEVCVVKQNQD